MGLSAFLRRAQLFYFTFKAVRRPDDLQSVLALSKILFSTGAIRALKKHCQLTRPEMFIKRPVFRPDLGLLSQLPPGSLGREYFEFLTENKIDPQNLGVPQDRFDPDEIYLFDYFYQTHDLYHLLTGFDTSVAGELMLQGFYLAQAPTPLAPLLIGMGILREFWFDPFRAQSIIGKIFEGYRKGLVARPLYGQDWLQEMGTPLVAVRNRMGLIEASELERPLFSGSPF